MATAIIKLVCPAVELTARWLQVVRVAEERLWLLSRESTNYLCLFVRRSAPSTDLSLFLPGVAVTCFLGLF